MILSVCLCGTGFLDFHHDLLVVVLEFGKLKVIIFHTEVLIVFEQGVPSVLIAADRISMFLELEVGLAERCVDVPLN